jgi:hypothetical protein
MWENILVGQMESYWVLLKVAWMDIEMVDRSENNLVHRTGLKMAELLVRG